jgi:hypothetical protein
MKFKGLIIFLLTVTSFTFLAAQEKNNDKILKAMKSISGESIMNYDKELCSPKYAGRLTGTPEYNKAAEWSASLFKKWGIKPAGDNKTYFQKFANPYTLVLDAGEVTLTNPTGAKDGRRYRYQEDYYPDATSDKGTVTAEVVYVGYGITAPELNYDDYKNVDVKGKIVLYNPEIPVSPNQDVETFKKWRPYSFHDYKARNAAAHGAAGVLFNYHLANPNGVFINGLVKADIGEKITNDILEGTGKKLGELLGEIRKNKVPVSFNTGKVVTIKMNTVYHPEGIGMNVVGVLKGSDEKLKDEYIIIGAHLDHLGMCHMMMPGANDNASADAVLFETAKALTGLNTHFKRSLIFVLFGAEEQGVKGSEFYVANLKIPKEKIVGFLNLESVGRGEKISASSGKDFPKLYEPFERNNNNYVKRGMTAGSNSNIARPRQDAAHFLWAGIPTISFGTYGAPELPFPTYHTTYDTPENLTPPVMEDLAKIVFLSTIDLLNK